MLQKVSYNLQRDLYVQPAHKFNVPQGTYLKLLNQ